TAVVAFSWCPPARPPAPRAGGGKFVCKSDAPPKLVAVPPQLRRKAPRERKPRTLNKPGNADKHRLRTPPRRAPGRNTRADWTKPAPRLYPHQWSWDSAFIAIGLAHVDAERALRELETLFAAQWADGRLPHIAFNPEAADYFPGPEWWASARTTPLAPRAPA